MIFKKRYHDIALLLFLSFVFLVFGRTENFAQDTAEDIASNYAGVEFKALDISERSYDGGSAIAVTFTVPLDLKKSYDGFLAVSEKGKGSVDGSWVISDNGLIAFFPHVKPATEYRVSVYQSLPAINGNFLDKSYGETITTRDAQEAVGFSSKGNILPGELTKGLPVLTINVNAVDVDFFKIEATKAPMFLSNWYYKDQARYHIDDWTGFGALVHSARFDLDPPPNKLRTVYLPVQKIKAFKKAGLYAAVMRKMGDYPHSYATTYFMISDLGLHVRQYKDQIDVHISSLKTAKSMKNVEISFLDKKGNTLVAGKTSKSGVANFVNPPQSAFLILAQKKEDLTILSLKEPILDLSEFPIGKRAFRAQELFLYGPRDLYRPGEQVQVSGLLRDQDGNLLSDLPLTASVHKPDGALLRSFTLQPEMAGYYAIDFKLDEGAMTGKWQLRAKTPDQTEHIYDFMVADFMPERMRLTFHTKEEYLPFHEEFTVKLNAAYLYGAPAAGNVLQGNIRVKANRYPIKKLKGFQFGNVMDKNFQYSKKLSDKTFDDEGNAEIKVAPKWEKKSSPLSVMVTASVLESGGRPVTRMLTQTMLPSKAIVGIRPLFLDDHGKGRADYDSSVSFEILKSDESGNLLEAKNLDLKLIREFRDYYWEYVNGQWSSKYSEKHYPAAMKAIDIKKGDRRKVDFPVEYGSYRLDVYDPETALTTSVRFYAGYWWGDEKSDGGERPDKVMLKLDRSAYKGGDVAELTLTPPHEGNGMVVVESDRPLWTQSFKVSKEGTTIKIPIDPLWKRHDIFISAMVVRPAAKTETHLPNRAFGLHHLPLDRTRRLLSVKIDAPEKIQPESEHPIRLKVAAKKGEALPDELFVTLAAVDVGVLNITDFKTPEPFDWFFEKRRYGTELRDVFGDVIEQGEGDAAKQRFGGDADLSRGGIEPGTKVQIVSIFKAPVKLDKKGEGTLTLNIPDFNGEMRLMALAFGKSHYGHSDAVMTVAAPIIADIAMPRFLAMGDRSILALDLHNLTDETQKINVSINSDGPVTIESLSPELTLKAREKVTRIYNIKAKHQMGTSGITLALNNKESKENDLIQIERNFTLGVRPAFPAVTQIHRQVVDQKHDMTIDASFIKPLIPDSVQCRSLLSDIPPFNLSAHLKSLIQYPYGCLEQTTSRAFPLIFTTPSNLKHWGIKMPKGFNREKAFSIALEKLASLQRSNGGFGLWGREGREAVYLTVYATDFLLSLRDSGVSVPKHMIDKALSRLTEYLRQTDGIAIKRYSDDIDHLAFTYRTYAAYVLSRVNQAPLSSLRNLFDHHLKDAKSGLPLVYLGVALKNQGDHKRSEKAFKKALSLDRDTNRYLGDYGSSIRDDALMVYLLLSNGKKIGDVQKKLFSLSDKLSERLWLSTQERCTLFMAGIATTKEKGDHFKAQIKIGKDTQEITATGSRFFQFTADQILKGVVLKDLTGAGKNLFGQYEIIGYSKKAPQPISNKINVYRDFYTMKGAPMKHTKLTVGDMVVTHVRVRSKQSVPHALLVDLLPAGLELEDQNLIHAVKIDDVLISGKYVRDWMSEQSIEYQGFRDDRYIAAINNRYYRESHLFYLARAVTPGDYQIPPSYVEDMYRPYIRAIGKTEGRLKVVATDAQE